MVGINGFTTYCIMYCRNAFENHSMTILSHRSVLFVQHCSSVRSAPILSKNVTHNALYCTRVHFKANRDHTLRPAVSNTLSCTEHRTLCEIALNDQSEGTVEGKVSSLGFVFGEEPWTSALPVCWNMARHVYEYLCNQVFLVSFPALAADQDSRMNESQSARLKCVQKHVWVVWVLVWVEVFSYVFRGWRKDDCYCSWMYCTFAGSELT